MPASSPRLRMFPRRLIIMTLMVVAAIAVLSAQLARLTVAHGAEHRERAESYLVRESWTPTVRGSILDRKGRVLAHDRASWTVVADYDVLTGQWARTQSLRYARKQHPDRWAESDAGQRAALAEAYEPAFRAHLDRMWSVISEASGESVFELDQKRVAIIERVNVLVATLVEARRNQEVAQYRQQMARGRELTTEIDDTPIPEGILARINARARRPIYEQESAHAVLPRVSDDVGFALLRHVGEMVEIDPVGSGDPGARVEVPLLPGVEVLSTGDRAYPYESVEVAIDTSGFPSPLRREGLVQVRVAGIDALLLGWMRSRHYKEDVQGRAGALEADPALRARALTASGTDRGRYFDADAVGARGGEALLETTLRGLRGLSTLRLDTGEAATIEPSPGRDVQLTLDIMLQARIAALMQPELGLARVQPWHGDADSDLPPGTPYNGAAVVLDIGSGDVLAMVSTPLLARHEISERWDDVSRDTINTPLLNKAVDVPYAVGSIAKAIVYCEAVRHGVVGLDEHIACTGHLFPGLPEAYRCWYYKQYGITHNDQLAHDLSPVEALMVSCNIYFYTLGQRLGIAGITDCYQDFGVGTPMDLGVTRVSPGFLGDYRAKMGEVRLQPNDPIFMGMGQGPVSWTPVHAANAFATLARGGVRLTPRMILDDSPPEAEDLDLDPRAIDNALKGLWRVVNDAQAGTANHLTINGVREPIFTAPGVDVWGKTGTATASPVAFDPDGEDGPTPPITRRGDHSWFVCLVGPRGEKPRYAIAVIMEWAGSGGRVSGPIANQIIQALLVEGYL